MHRALRRARCRQTGANRPRRCRLHAGTTMTGKQQTPRVDWPPSTPAELLKLLEANDGTLNVIDPSREVRAAWRSLLHLMRRDGHVPDGWHLLHRGRDV